MKEEERFFKQREEMDNNERERVLRGMEKMERKFKVHYVWITEKVSESRIAYDICFNRKTFTPLR
jgi:hypothetical protein